MKSKKNLGIKTLIDICNIRYKPINLSLRLFLGPRINAGGRVGKCSHGANLLLKDNPKEVFQLASELNQLIKNETFRKDNYRKIFDCFRYY